MHEDMDMVVGHEVCFEGSLPFHVVFSCEHWQVPVAREGASRIEGHSRGNSGNDSGTCVLCSHR